MSTTLFAPFSSANFMLGSAASMRCVFVTALVFLSRGTLKSTRMITRLSASEAPIFSSASFVEAARAPAGGSGAAALGKQQKKARISYNTK